MSVRWRHPPLRALSAALAAVTVAGLAVDLEGPATAAAPGGVVISEFRFRGPSGGNDEFVELRNTRTAAVGIGGWKLVGCNSAGLKTVRATVPDGVSLPAGGSYLFANTASSGYSGSALPDVTYTTGITDTGGVQLQNGANAVEDAAGSDQAPADCREGAGLVLPTTAGQNAFERKGGGVQDSDDNAVDFEGPKAGNPRSCGAGCPATAVRPIGEVQGAVADGADAATHASPLTGQTVAVRGVISQRTLTASSQRGFFLQSTPATADADARSSDAIFVFMGTSSALGSYVPQVGDEVVLQGRVGEFFNMTQITAPSLVRIAGSGAGVTPFEADPPDDLQEAARYWERREAMQARVPASSIVLGGRSVFAGPDSEVWVARPDEPIAQRPDPYARRSFRDPHPLDNRPERFDDGNGYRILLGSFGLKGATGESQAVLAPARTYDTVTNSPTGGVYYNFGKYAVMAREQIVLARGVDPAQNAPPGPPSRPQEYSVATYNVENLYDFRDDPHDGCDFPGNAGCPGASPPFDYVPAGEADYRAHLDGIAAQVVEDLHSPEVLLVQEAEDQDICRVEAAALHCGTDNNADGRPDTLQELALAISARGGPRYEAASDRDGADDRGIVSAFLYRSDRVELPTADRRDPVLGREPQLSYTPGYAYNRDVQNPKALNAPLPEDVRGNPDRDGNSVYTRPPQVARFHIWRAGVGAGRPVEVYMLSNHFSSTPDRRVAQRREQSAYNASILAALQAADPGERLLTGGDFNVYPRPDDPLPSAPSDQLGPIYERGLQNLFDVLVGDVPASAYSYVFQGQTQTLDQQFVSPSLRGDLRQVRAAHINADFPAEFDGDGSRGASDHDPLVSRFAFPPPTPPGGHLPYYKPPGPELPKPRPGRPRISLRGKPRRCVRRSFRLRVRIRSATPLRRSTVSLDGRRLHSTRRARYSVRIPARRLRRGRHRIVVAAVDRNGARGRRTLRFRRCR